jgi:hypothetical protein
MIPGAAARRVFALSRSLSLDTRLARARVTPPHTNTHVHTHTHMYTHTHTHTHTHTPSRAHSVSPSHTHTCTHTHPETTAPDLESHGRLAAVGRLHLNRAALRGVDELLFPLGRARRADCARISRQALDLLMACYFVFIAYYLTCSIDLLCCDKTSGKE